MNTKHPFGMNVPAWLGFALLPVLAGCVAETAGYYSETGAPGDGYVVVQSDGDFYGPLSPYGRWETVAGYGMCWIPSDVGSDWEPYEDGSWISTDGGWYWQSDEPWGWATYHYGRWFDDPGLGWCWVPGTQWAPAWVSWCDNDDYVGWAPLPPAGGFFAARAATVAPRNYIVVPRRQFLDPVRPAEVARFRTQPGVAAQFSANLRVNRRGPEVAAVARASGRQVQPRPVTEIRRRTEATVVQNRRRFVSPTATPSPNPSRRENRRASVPAAEPRVFEPAPAPVPRAEPAIPVPTHTEPTPAQTVRRVEPVAPPVRAPVQPERRVEPMAPPPEARRAPPPPREEKRPPPKKERRDDQQ